MPCSSIMARLDRACADEGAGAGAGACRRRGRRRFAGAATGGEDRWREALAGRWRAATARPGTSYECRTCAACQCLAGRGVCAVASRCAVAAMLPFFSSGRAGSCAAAVCAEALARILVSVSAMEPGLATAPLSGEYE